MTHLKRHKASKHWPMAKKGSAYLVNPRSYKETGIPIIVLIRDLMGIAKRRREVKKALHEGQILLNGKRISDEKNSAKIFDILTIVPTKENYQITLGEKGKFTIEKTKDSSKKISKVMSRTRIKQNKIQINFSDGFNIISDENLKVGDSCLIDLTKKKIEKVLPLKIKSKVLVVRGKYAGERGTIIKLDLEKKTSEVKTSEENINVQLKQMIVIE